MPTTAYDHIENLGFGEDVVDQPGPAVKLQGKMRGVGPDDLRHRRNVLFA